MDWVVAVDKLMWKLMLLMKLGMHAILELRGKEEVSEEWEGSTL